VSRARLVLGAAAAAVALVVLALVLRGSTRQPSAAVSLPQITLGGSPRDEGCLLCHADVQGLGAAHDALGCSPCHLGDARERDKDAAHRGLELLAGDLSTVDRTCGQGACHAVETARVRSSLMARAPGILAVDRFAFGERASPTRDRTDELTALDPQAAPASPAESHVRKLCASCHLGVRKDRPGDHGEDARGGGCTACHLAPPSATARATGGPLHPDVSALVSERRCAGCHGRSGRITLSYRGVVELEPGDPRVTGRTADGRPTGPATPDVHAAAGMTCIDCHVERELMGDGQPHLHPHEALEVRCADCHGSGLDGPRLAPEGTARDADREQVAEALRRSWQRRGLSPLSNTPVYTARGTPLARTDGRARTLRRVEDGVTLAIPPATPSATHTLPGHTRLACQACHSSWAPRCRSCHTRLDPEGTDLDHLSGRQTPGRWVETAGANGAGPPLLAVGPRGQIEPFVEGMTLTLVVGSSSTSRRLYAPLEPHTTGAARSCASCHEAVDEVYPSRGEVTRLSARLLTSEERARVAQVGRCLGCHPRPEDAIYRDFGRSLVRRTPRCRLAPPP
jgi:hypothetical protein